MNSSVPGNKFIPSGCEVYETLGGRINQTSTCTQTFLIIIVVINVITVPFTVVLNALVMIAVKMKSRLRMHKSNIALALLASTDFVVGLLIQPSLIALTITVLLDSTSSASCSFQVFATAVPSVLVSASLIHLALVSAERFLAMTYPFAYTTLVTDARFLVASILAWLLSIILHVPLAVNKSLFLLMWGVFAGVCISFIFFCHVTVYREIRRIEQQIADQQVTQEAKEQFQRDKKAFKLTFIILVVLILCYMPGIVVRTVLLRYRSEVSLDVVYILGFLALSMTSLNSFFNPIIYSVRLREFRVSFVELICRTMNIAQAEEIEMRLFGAPNATGQMKAEQEPEEKSQQNTEHGNTNNNHGAIAQGLERVASM